MVQLGPGLGGWAPSISAACLRDPRRCRLCSPHPSSPVDSLRAPDEAHSLWSRAAAPRGARRVPGPWGKSGPRARAGASGPSPA